VAAENRLGRMPADCGLHRAEHRLGPRLAQDASRPRRRRLQDFRRQDLDHASGARRPDDPARAHGPERARLQGPLHVARAQAARDGPRSVPGARHVGSEIEVLAIAA
jgi:hypothetical protein